MPAMLSRSQQAYKLLNRPNSNFDQYPNCAAKPLIHA
jgi:hypothetical protein